MSDQSSIQPWQGTAEAYQDHVLPLVSRTFALTIPQLPAALRRVVANAYLLCRAADTIEDDAALDADQKRRYEEELVEVVTGRRDAQAFAAEIAPLLSPQTLEAERELLARLALVIEVTRSFSKTQRAAIERCIQIMGRGMHHFQRGAGVHGLATQRDMDSYCYYVAGVVGEMLTDLFCDYSAEIAGKRAMMRRLAVSFGQGLQMTNILKDQWEDRARGACWLPREAFRRHGIDLSHIAPGQNSAAYGAGLRELIGLTHAHLRNALAFTLLLPKHEVGIRRFCYWAIGLAVLTLRNIQERPTFTAGAEVKVTRGRVATTIMLTNLSVRSNVLLDRLFDFAAAPLPYLALANDWGDSFELAPAHS